jgi:hypothetical protein
MCKQMTAEQLNVCEHQSQCSSLLLVPVLSLLALLLLLLL